MICPFQTEGKRQLEASLLLCFQSESLFRQVITWQTLHALQMSPRAGSEAHSAFSALFLFFLLKSEERESVAEHENDRKL